MHSGSLGTFDGRWCRRHCEKSSRQLKTVVNLQNSHPISTSVHMHISVCYFQRLIGDQAAVYFPHRSFRVDGKAGLPPSLEGIVICALSLLPRYDKMRSRLYPLVGWLVGLFTWLPLGMGWFLPFEAFFLLLLLRVWYTSAVHTRQSPTRDGYEPKVPPVVFHFVSHICCMVEHGSEPLSVVVALLSKLINTLNDGLYPINNVGFITVLKKYFNI